MGSFLLCEHGSPTFQRVGRLPDNTPIESPPPGLSSIDISGVPLRTLVTRSNSNPFYGPQWLSLSHEVSKSDEIQDLYCLSYDFNALGPNHPHLPGWSTYPCPELHHALDGPCPHFREQSPCAQLALHLTHSSLWVIPPPNESWNPSINQAPSLKDLSEPLMH